MDRGVDLFQYARRSLHHVVVPKAKDSITFAFEPCGSLVVARSMIALAVLRTVDFNHQSCGHAGEIDEIGTDRHLAAKMAALEVELPKVVPKQLFSFGCAGAELPRCLVLSTGDQTAIHHADTTPPTFG